MRDSCHPSAFGFRGRFLVTPEERTGYSTSSGILAALPDAVAVPVDVRDVSALLAWAREHGIAIHPRGAGTGMPGGNLGPGVAVDLVSGFRPPPQVDPAERCARVAPGATLAELNAEAARFGLHFPVDPASGARCTLGGMIANNSAGAHSVKYGATRDWVESLRVVLADGSVADLRRGEDPPDTLREILDSLDAFLEPRRAEIIARWPQVRKNSSGYALREYLMSGDALDLIVGSEGTLGLVVAAKLRLHRPPPLKGVALLEFATLESAGEAILNLLPLQPATCEILDRSFLELVHESSRCESYPLHPGIEALLIIEVEAADPGDLQARLDALGRAVRGIATGMTTATDPPRVDELWQIRHAASPVIAETAAGLVSMQFIEDSVVPVERLPRYILRLREILTRHDLPAVIFGHAGDGNLHVNPLVDVRLPRWREKLEVVLSDVAATVVALGGTLAGEHGDGRLRAPYLARVWGEPIFSCFAEVKRLFDPAGILNPGVVLPLPGQRPFDLVRSYP